MEVPDSERSGGIVLEFPANDDLVSSSTPSKLPRRLRRRLMESKSPSTAEEIQAKLHEADLRRQQFYELLSSKARPKWRSSTQYSCREEDLGQRLEAKLNAADQKRLGILTEARMRLAQQDVLRQAAKSGVELRLQRERDELSMKVKSRVEQVEAKRMLLFDAYRQCRASRRERAARSLVQKMVKESKYKECVRDAIYQKRAAADRNRRGLLEAEKTRARTPLLKVRRVAKYVLSQREIERLRKKEQLEYRLQRAKSQRAEYLRQRRSLHCSAYFSLKVMQEQQEHLARKIARCWRQFAKLRKTTFSLTKAFRDLKINAEYVKSMAFEQLALKIEADTTLQTVRALLARVENRYLISKAVTGSLSTVENIDHLIKLVGSPMRRGSTGIKGRGAEGILSRKAARTPVKPRYPARVLLCAYMILGHADAVFIERGELENAMVDSAVKLVRAFELLINIILEGPMQTDHVKELPNLPSHLIFKPQLEAFDKAWCSYLSRFVAWKARDAKLLEDELVRVACQLEQSIMQSCELTPGGADSSLACEVEAIRKKIREDQKLLRRKIQHLSGDAGLSRLESALSDVRSTFSQATETSYSSASQEANMLPTRPLALSERSFLPISGEMSKVTGGCESKRSGHLTCSVEKNDPSTTKEVSCSPTSRSNGESHVSYGTMSVGENEVLVNEIVHHHFRDFSDILTVDDGEQSSVKEKVRETMEKAFWDSLMDSLKQDEPDFSWVIKLMKEVRDELSEMSPKSWRNGIAETINIEILSQVLESGTFDMDYFGKILEFALVTLQKLSAPAKEEEMKTTHHKLIKELLEVSQGGDKSKASFAVLMIEGLQFILQQIQTLKREISKARLRIVEPFIKGAGGLEYLRNAFVKRFGSPIDAPTALPITRQWLSSVYAVAEQEWTEHTDSLSVSISSVGSSQRLLPTTLRSGGSIPIVSKISIPSSFEAVEDLPKCKGEMVDLLVRLGLLKLVKEVRGLTLETLPETLMLNLTRLRVVQHQLQKVIVTAVSLLVLRQILLSENSVSTSAVMENTASSCIKELSELLETVDDAGISEIVEKISGLLAGDGHVLTPEDLQARKQVMANMLRKSLQDGDVVFTRVSHNVYLAARGVVLGGSGTKGKQLAETALKRIGAVDLADTVVKTVEVLIRVAVVSCTVHGAWYKELLKNL